MRMIAGALLIAASSVWGGAETIAQATVYAHNRSGNPGGGGWLAAIALGLLGLILLAAGLVSDRPLERRP